MRAAGWRSGAITVQSPSACQVERAPLQKPVVLTVTALQKAFGGQVVLAGVNWFVPTGGRVALVGANGSGKSTFLRIIAGQVEADGGSISVRKNASVGYLPQEVLGLS